MNKTQLEKAIIFLAECIELGQESLLPLFLQYEKELEALQVNESALDRARRIAGSKVKAKQAA